MIAESGEERWRIVDHPV